MFNNTSRKAENKYNNIEVNFHQKILNVMINQKCDIAKQTKKEMTMIKQMICRSVPAYVSNRFFYTQEIGIKNRATGIKQSNINKFNKLKEKAMKERGFGSNEECFRNLSSVDIPVDIKKFLSLGKNFSLPYKKTDYPLFQVIADGEECIKTIIDSKKQNVARSHFCQLVSNNIQNIKMNKFGRLVNRLFEDTKRFLAKHKNIIILSADKGNITVAMDENDYTEKMNNMLSDRHTYWTLRSDPTSSLQSKNNEMVNYLRMHNYIDEKTKVSLITYKAIAPRIYGQPKVHKQTCPLRPIISLIESPVYQLSKFIAEILSKSFKSNFNIRNSIEIKDILADITMEDSEVMVSFDAISLFTNIPVRLVIRIIEEKWEKVEANTAIPKRKFLEILKLCLIDGNYFLYRKKFYKQTFGFPMGSLLASIIADILLDHVLSETSTKMDYTPKLIKKYVDDIVGIIPKNKVEYTLSILNKFHNKLKFNVEEENNGKLAYLDIMMIRKNGIIILDWYKKPTKLLFVSTKTPKK